MKQSYKKVVLHVFQINLVTKNVTSLNNKTTKQYKK